MSSDKHILPFFYFLFKKKSKLQFRIKLGVELVYILKTVYNINEVSSLTFNVYYTESLLY